jgi:fructose-bisphosphate aldolase class II
MDFLIYAVAGRVGGGPAMAPAYREGPIARLGITRRHQDTGDEMPVATPDQYAEMLDTAKKNIFAFPAINVSSSSTINAVLQGLTEAGSDGIIQVTTGGADFFAGHTVKARATGALAMAKYVHEVAKSYPITVAVHTDHCPKDALEGFVYPLIAASEEEVKAGREPIFQSHMWDGSAVPLAENLEIAQQILAKTTNINAILEVEIGVVGGEEDGVSHDINENLYTTLDDAIAMVEALGLGDKGRYMAALTFGNVHGVYKPGNVKLRPEILADIQDGLAAKYGTDSKPLDLVFHGGSGSTEDEIFEAVRNGVVKMNLDTDTQYAYTRSVADTVLTNYAGVLKVDGEVGNKKVYDPRSWGKLAETAMATRVVDYAKQLGSAGHALK